MNLGISAPSCRSGARQILAVVFARGVVICHDIAMLGFWLWLGGRCGVLRTLFRLVLLELFLGDLHPATIAPHLLEGSPGHTTRRIPTFWVAHVDVSGLLLLDFFSHLALPVCRCRSSRRCPHSPSCH